MSADALPTVQQNGVIWSQVTVGDTVYATGSFSETWPAGSTDTSAHDTARANLLAYNLTTGDLTSFNHQLNAQGLVISASTDGSHVYVGGDFTAVDGKSRQHFAVFDTATGALDSTMAPSLGGEVAAMTETSSTVYVGGNFFSADGVPRTRLAAFSASTGALLPWAPTADDAAVMSMVVTPDKSRVVVGGHFSTLNKVTVDGLGALDATSGATLPFAANQRIKDYGASAGITTLTTDGSQVYAGGYTFIAQGGPVEGNFEGTAALNPTTGAINWVDDCHGDTYDLLPLGQILYSVSHAHDCSAIGDFPDTDPRINHHAMAETIYPTGTDKGPDSYGWNYKGLPDSTLLHWFPDLAIGSYTGQDQAAWSITGNSTYIALAGEFPEVNGVAQQGIVRFAISSVAPNKVGPLYTPTALTPKVVALSATDAYVTWTTTWDYDNHVLTYKLYRDDSTTPIYTTNEASNFWQLPGLSFNDTTVTAGSTHTYRVRVSDPFGNTTNGSATSITLPGYGSGGGSTTTASDKFARTVSGGWGSATSGGPWNTTTASALSVSSGTGLLTMAKPASSTNVYLANLSSRSTDTTATLSSNKAATGGGTYLYVVGRRISASVDYRARIRLISNGTVGVSLLSENGGTEKTLAGETVLPGVKFSAGTKLDVRLQVTGTNPTTVQVKVWPATAAQPSAWQLTTTDSGAGLQTAGSVGFASYLSGSATNAPVAMQVTAFATGPVG